MGNKLTNVLFAGIGGQGIIKASDMLTEAAFRMNYDVKKSELHGMSQRGGSVSSDVRFGDKVYSPMIPEGLRESIFQSGFSTKSAGRGMGLAIVREIVGRWGAKLTLDSDEKETRFCVTMTKNPQKSAR